MLLAMRPFSRIAATVDRIGREAREFRRLRRSRAAQIAIDVPFADGRLESIDLHADGTLAVAGWTPDLGAFADRLSIEQPGGTCKPSHVFRVSRPELERWRAAPGLIGA